MAPGSCWPVRVWLWFRPGGGYTTVHTVFSVVSKRTALASVGFRAVSYMGFSKEACPLLLSWPA